MKQITRSRIVAIDQNNKIVLGPPIHPGYDPIPYATAIQCCEAKIIANTQAENPDIELKQEIQSELKKMLQIGKQK